MKLLFWVLLILLPLVQSGFFDHMADHLFFGHHHHDHHHYSGYGGYGGGYYPGYYSQSFPTYAPAMPGYYYQQSYVPTSPFYGKRK